MSSNFLTNILRTVSIRVLNILALMALVVAAEAATQAKRAEAPDYTWGYIGTGFLVLLLAGVAFLWYLMRRGPSDSEYEEKRASRTKKEAWESDALDGDMEMEWLRKHNNIINKKRPKRNSAAKTLSKEKVAQLAKLNQAQLEAAAKIKDIQLAGLSDLPFSNIFRLEYPHLSDALQTSDDEGLIEAIDQVLDEFNEDEEMKEVAMRILAASRARNSVEALAQVALYDLSANVRSKAIEFLSEFDHHTVFETIIIACADPTREVRAAAARGLTRLSFNRGDAWARAALLDDQGRKRQIARAAIEGGLVERYFDRLIHSDMKQAYEAFALMTLLLKARETDPIANALEDHQNNTVRIALIHVIKVNKEDDALPYLMKLVERRDLPKEVFDAVEAAIAKFTPETEEV